MISGSRSQSRLSRSGKSETRAERNIRWIERHCRIPEGKDVDKPVLLREWQKADLRKIYDNPHGTRLAILSFAKKNAKTSLSAFLLLLHLVGPESVPNTQLRSTARSKDQATVLFALAAKVVRLSPTLRGAVTVRDTIKELYCPSRGTSYKALSAEASTAHGQSPIFAVHDELGQVRGPVSELYSAIENAMGAHEAPLSIVISTQAPTDGDLLSILIDKAREGTDPRIVLSLYTADKELDPFSEEAIRQANPAFGDFLNAEEVLYQAKTAKDTPSQQSLYCNYTLNQRVEARDSFITPTVWRKCSFPVLEDWRGRPVYGGLDLSENSDLTALVLVTQHEGQWHVRPTFWLPGEGLLERARGDRVPYDLWAKEGHLVAVAGTQSVEYEYVAAHLRDLFDELDIRKVAFDRYNLRHLRPWLRKVGFTDAEMEEKFEEFGQGFVSMSPALRTLETAVRNQRLAHGNHPVLTMCMDRAVVMAGPTAGTRKLGKKHRKDRIDGAVSLAMAMAVAETYEAAAPLDVLAMIG